MVEKRRVSAKEKEVPEEKVGYLLNQDKVEPIKGFMLEEVLS